MKFAAYPETEGSSNIVVDGSPNASTLLTLSHWPKSGTLGALKADLSTQIVFRYLRNPSFHVDAPFATNDHFDEDGLAGLFALLNPEDGLARQTLLCEIASAGDFGVYSSREAARVAFTIAAFANPELSPLGKVVFAQPYANLSAVLYTDMLQRLPDIMDNPVRYQRFWQPADRCLEHDLSQVQRGRVRVSSVPHLDLGIIDFLDFELSPEAEGHPLGEWCSPLVIHGLCENFCLLFHHERRYELKYRYESWVQYQSRRPRPRVDLRLLAKQLNQAEKNGAWSFEGVEAGTPCLSLSGAGESSLDFDYFFSSVRQFLESAPPAWNPYD